MGNNDPANRLVAGDVFAVLTNKGNYAKVKVVTYGYDLQIQWVTYKPNPAYSVLGTGYSNPEDVKISRDDNHLYITERASGSLNGTLVRVAFGAANRAAATVIASGMTAPQQLVLDEATMPPIRGIRRKRPFVARGLDQRDQDGGTFESEFRRGPGVER